MKEKYRNLIAYLLDRMGESSTWQGLGFFLAIIGAKQFGELDWGAAAAFGGGVSGIIKILLADKLK